MYEQSLAERVEITGNSTILPKDTNNSILKISRSRQTKSVNVNVVVVQSLCHVRLFVTPWTVACQASLSFTISQSLLKFMLIELVMPSNHLILCGPLPLLPSIFPSIRLFSNELALHLRWPKYWSFSFSISPSNEYWISLLSNGLSRVFSNITAQKHKFFGIQVSLQSNSHIPT